MSVDLRIRTCVQVHWWKWKTKAKDADEFSCIGVDVRHGCWEGSGFIQSYPSILIARDVALPHSGLMCLSAHRMLPEPSLCLKCGVLFGM
jgi:hypothetical protein